MIITTTPHQENTPHRARANAPLLRYRPIMAVVAVLLIAFGLRMWHLNTESIWHDEGWSIRAFRGPFTTPDDNTPYAYYLTGHLLWRAGAGESPLALRYVSVLLGTLTIAAGIRIAWRWYGVFAGVAFGLMVGFSPLLWEYSQEVRAYVAVPLVALALIAGADALLRRRPGEIVPRRVWVFVFGAELIGLYTHNLAVPLVVWLNAALGVVWLLRRDWRPMFTWAGMQIALIVAYIPWLLTQSPSGTPLNTPPEPGLGLVRDVWYSYFLPVLPQLRAVNNAVLLNLLLMAVLVAMVVLLLRSLFAPPQDQHRGWLLVSHAVLVPAFSTALMLAANIDFHPRYYIAALPGTLLVVVAIIGQWKNERAESLAHNSDRQVPFMVLLNPTLTLPVDGEGTPPPESTPSSDFGRGWEGGKWVGKRSIDLKPYLHTLRNSFLVVVVGIFGLVSIQSLQAITTTREYQHDDFRALADYYATLPAEAVILIPFNAERALQDYYDPVLNIQAQFVNIPLYADEATALQVLEPLMAEAPRHIEFLTWFQLPADPRGMYPCLLSALSSANTVPETRTFFGLSTQAFEIGPVGAFRPIAAAPRYQEATLQDAAYLTNGRSTCVRTGWQLQQPVAENISVAASLLNPFGEPLTRSDAEIARPDNVGTARWAVDDEGQAYNLLTLPEGAPLMAYDLTLNLYTRSQDTGFDLLDVSGNPAGKTLVVATAVQTGGDTHAFSKTTLAADNAPENTVETGIPLDITLELAEDLTPPVEVSLTGNTWQETQMADTVGLSWHRFIIPPGHSGTFELMVNAESLAQYTVVDPSRLFEAPDYRSEVGAVFPGVGVLVGATVDATLTSAQNPEITLVWQAEATPETAYTVFVQLISEDGVLLAQSDSPPASGTRPTTGWIEGEYIVDNHTLIYNEAGNTYTGTASIIAGFYDADANFARVLTASGSDYAPLPPSVTIAD